jgi:heme-degrading monooxygenase HmoA
MKPQAPLALKRLPDPHLSRLIPRSSDSSSNDNLSNPGQHSRRCYGILLHQCNFSTPYLTQPPMQNRSQQRDSILSSYQRDTTYKMSPTTEVAFLPLRPGVDIDDISCPEGKVMAHMLEAGKVAPGCTKNYSGLEEENPGHVHLILGMNPNLPLASRERLTTIDWESLEAHRAYQARPEYPEFLKAARSMVNPDEKNEAFHVSFSPHPPTKALHSPVAEVIRAYFPVDQQSSEGETFESDLKKLVKALETHKVAGFTGDVSSGWSIEEVDRDGVQCRVFVAVVGWDSVAAHTEATKTDVFENNPVRNMPKSMTVVHVKFKSP